MAEPISMASGVAGLVTLSAAVLTAGYKYLSSVSSAPEDFKGLIRETASLNTVLAQLISYSLYERKEQHNGCDIHLQLDVLRDCEETLRNVQTLIYDCEVVSSSGRKNAVNALLWPLKKRDIVKNRERLERLCANLQIGLSVETAVTVRTIETGQRRGNEAIDRVAQISIDTQERRILEWLSSLVPTVKHTNAMLSKQPGTNEWLFLDQIFLEWLDHGKTLWLSGGSGTGKTVLM